MVVKTIKPTIVVLALASQNQGIGAESPARTRNQENNVHFSLTVEVLHCSLQVFLRVFPQFSQSIAHLVSGDSLVGALHAFCVVWCGKPDKRTQTWRAFWS
jgi:hypothetical protein